MKTYYTRPDPETNLPALCTVVVDDDALHASASLVQTYVLLPKAVDPSNVEIVDDFAVSCRRFLKNLEAARKKAKEPSLLEGREIDAIAALHAGPVEQMLEVASASVLAVRRAVEAERVRLEAERQRAAAEAAERERLLVAARAEVDATGNAGDRAALDSLVADHQQAASRAYLATLEAEPPELKLATTGRSVETVEVVDAALVPVSIAGVELRPIDMAVAKKLLKAGVSIPGLTLNRAEKASTRSR